MMPGCTDERRSRLGVPVVDRIRAGTIACPFQRLVLLGAAALLLTGFTAAQSQDPQSQDSMTRWGEATLDKLEPFLPDARPLGFSPELANPAADFKAFANQAPRKYLELLVHKNWWFNDAELSRKLEEVQKEEETLKQEMEGSFRDFETSHGSEMEALKKSHNVGMEAASKQAQALFQQGKYAEGKAVLDNIKPFHYAPLESMTASFDKRQQDLDGREKGLLARRRSVSFRIYTNRTAMTTAISRKSNAPEYQIHPNGTLGGHPLYRQAQITGLDPQLEQPEIKLAVYLGPVNFQNPQLKLGEADLKVKSIVVWAWIESRPDTVQADEAAVKKVLATMDYDGFIKLIEQ
ncbi:MAG TPA: hypothetical protein VN176_04790 [Verrucomicrobiae bacterium]|jgi:hypothetical protein|nr:hypothetical protein [Verrucomicrobiae bacterium]